MRGARLAIVVPLLAFAASCGEILSADPSTPPVAANADAAADNGTSDAAPDGDASPAGASRFCDHARGAFCSGFDDNPDVEGWTASTHGNAQGGPRSSSALTWFDIALPTGAAPGELAEYRLARAIALGTSRSITMQISVNVFASSPSLTLFGLQINAVPPRTILVTSSDVETTLTVFDPSAGATSLGSPRVFRGPPMKRNKWSRVTFQADLRYGTAFVEVGDAEDMIIGANQALTADVSEISVLVGARTTDLNIPVDVGVDDVLVLLGP